MDKENLKIIHKKLIYSNKLDIKKSNNIDNLGQVTRKKYFLVDLKEHIFFDGSKVVYTGENINADYGDGYETIIPEETIEHNYQNLTQKMYIETTPTNDLNIANIKIIMNPNRFIGDTENEKLIKILVKDILPMINKPRIGHIDLNMDTPYDIKYFNFKYIGKKKAHINTNIEQYGKDSVLLSKTITVNPNSHEFTAIMYDKIRERMNAAKEDNSYISRNYAKMLYKKRYYLTRLEIRLLKANEVKKFLINPKNTFKDFDFRYRNTSTKGYFGSMEGCRLISDNRQDTYKKANKESKKAYNQLIKRELKNVYERLLRLPYIDNGIISNTIDY
jgi:hypothetical protein